jgi:hypothetical protein
MSDAKAGVLVMLASVAMALVGVFMWQGVWAMLTVLGLLVAFLGIMLFLISVSKTM